jgi:hypothetical protein
MSAGIILIEDEPLQSVLVTWLSWMTVMIIFAMSVIYLSNYFARSSECLTEKNTPFQTIDGMYVSTGRIRDTPFQTLDRIESFTVPNPYSNSKQTVGCLIDHERPKDLSGDHYYLA